MRNYRSNTNRLANLKSNPVVKAAIQRDKDIKTTQRSANFGYAAASLLIPGGFLTGIGRKAIGQAFKKAGTAGNRKPADTVGNRLKQAQGILGKKATELTRNKPYFSLTKKQTSLRNPRTEGLERMKVKSKAEYIADGGPDLTYISPQRFVPTFSARKTDRTLLRAVEQGPAKFFSKPKNPKTGVVRNKRKERYGSTSYNPEDGIQPNFGAQGGTSKGSLLRFKKKVEPYNLF